MLLVGSNSFIREDSQFVIAVKYRDHTIGGVGEIISEEVISELRLKDS